MRIIYTHVDSIMDYIPKNYIAEKETQYTKGKGEKEKLKWKRRKRGREPGEREENKKKEILKYSTYTCKEEQINVYYLILSL